VDLSGRVYSTQRWGSQTQAALGATRGPPGALRAPWGLYRTGHQDHYMGG